MQHQRLRRLGVVLVAGGFTLSFIGLLAPLAGATHVTSYPLPGNPHCGPTGPHLHLGLSEKDSLGFHGNGTSGPITMTNATDSSFDFTSTRLVLAVIIKRANGADIYDYRPVGGTFGDTGLKTTVKNSISHVQFCFGAAAATTTTAAPTTTTAAPTTTTAAPTTTTAAPTTTTAAPTTTTAAPTTTTAAPTTTTAAPTTTTVTVAVLPLTIENTTTTLAPTAATTTTTPVAVKGVEINRAPLARTGFGGNDFLVFGGFALALGGLVMLVGEPAAVRRPTPVR